MKCFIIVVTVFSTMASAVDTSGWYIISDLDYCMVSPGETDNSEPDALMYHPDIEFHCSSDILRCEFEFSAADTNQPVNWTSDQIAFFYIEYPGDFLYFDVTHTGMDIPVEVYPDSVSADSLEADAANTVILQDGSVLTFYLEHVINPEIYW